MVVARLVFTITMIVALVMASVYVRGYLGASERAILRAVGFSAERLMQGNMFPLLSSVFFTSGGWPFYGALAMLAGSVGWAEYQFGTRVAALTFFGIHIVTLLLLAFAISLPMAWLDSHRGELLFMVRDVGPSAGYYGCLGLAVTSLSPRKRFWLVVSLGGYLLIRVVWSTMHIPAHGRMMSADVAHFMAFALGLLSSCWLQSRKHLHSSPPENSPSTASPPAEAMAPLASPSHRHHS